MNLYVFGEGKTEERLIKQLMAAIAPDVRMDFRQSEGRGRLVTTIVSSLGPELEQPVCCLVLVDRDNGDSIDSIRERYKSSFQALLEERGFSSIVSFRALEENENVLELVLNPPGSPDLRVALHVAETPDSLRIHGFNNDTTDGYILAAALTEPVLERFAKKAGIDSQRLSEKVAQEIPDLMKANGVRALDAKDLIAAYMAAARFLKVNRSEAEDTFAGIVVARAIRYARQDFDRIVSSIVAAINVVVNEEDQRK